MRNHLKYRNIHPAVVGVTEALFAEKPWRLEDPVEQTVLVQRWLDAVSASYGIDTPQFSIGGDAPLAVDTGESVDEYGNPTGVVARATITENKLSLTSLFFGFRHIVNVRRPEKNADPMGWACSLFYTVRPVMFRARVREGRIVGMGPADAYRTQTFEALRQRGIVNIWDELEEGQHWPTLEELAEIQSDLLDSLSEAQTVTAEAGTTPVVIVARPRDEYDNMNTTQLRTLASQRGIPGAWSNRTDENRTLLRQQDANANVQ